MARYIWQFYMPSHDDDAIHAREIYLYGDDTEAEAAERIAKVRMRDGGEDVIAVRRQGETAWTFLVVKVKAVLAATTSPVVQAAADSPRCGRKLPEVDHETGKMRTPRPCTRPVGHVEDCSPWHSGGRVRPPERGR